MGASGGIGHLAVQIAMNIGARVFAVASGEDGVAMIRKLEVDAVVDGHREDVMFAAIKFALKGFNAALFTTGGELANSLVQCVRANWCIAYPNGIYPIPKSKSDISITGYNGEPELEILQRINDLISSGKIKAHLALNNHYLGKLCLQVSC